MKFVKEERIYLKEEKLHNKEFQELVFQGKKDVARGLLHFEATNDHKHWIRYR